MLGLCCAGLSVRGEQGVEQLDDAGAGAVAALLSILRGRQAPGAAPLNCRTVTADFIADIFTVRLAARLLSIVGQHARHWQHGPDSHATDTSAPIPPKKH